MADYQIFALDSGGLALTNHDVRCETDDQARLHCHQCLPGEGFAELWSGPVCIDRISVPFVQQQFRR